MMRSAGAALFCSALAQFLTRPGDELPSEAVCWVLLPALAQLARRLGRGSDGDSALPDRPPRSTRVWLRALWFSLGVVAACVYRAEGRVIVLFPLLTPLLLHFGVRPVSTSAPNDSRIFSWPPSLTVTWCAAVIATFTCLVLWQANGPTAPYLAGCVVVVALLFGGYLAISRPASAADTQNAQEAGGEQSHGDGAEHTMPEDFPVWTFAFCILLLLVSIIGSRIVLLHDMDVPVLSARATAAGMVKALCWLFTIRAATHSSWSVASTIGTFAIASVPTAVLPASPSLHLHVHSSSHLVAALLSLGQTIDLVSPKGSKSRIVPLWALGIIPLVPYLATISDIDIRTATTNPFSSPPPPPPPRALHPVDALALAAEARFIAMLARQSRSYADAAAEYRRRYDGLEPPPGFEGWYDFAVARGSPIIDEFDMIHEMVAPFLRVSGARVREAMVQVEGQKDDVAVWKCVFRGATTGETTCSGPATGGGYVGDVEETFGRWLGNVTGGVMPDVEFLVNQLDEPRVMFPTVLPPADAQAEGNSLVKVSHRSRGPIWDVVTRSCPRDDAGVLVPQSQRMDHAVELYDIPFVTDSRAEKDLCQHEGYREMHGLLMSPCSFILLDGFAPVLTPGTLSTMGDIMFPSPAYGDKNYEYDDAGDVDWDEKQDNVFWTGSTTGGFATTDEWRRYHRQRFVALAQGRETGKSYPYLHNQHGALERVVSSSFDTGLYNVSFTHLVQCGAEACEAERDFFGIGSWVDKDAPLKSKLVFDTDGNGISGRFTKLLASRSAVLKQALMREWHDERLAAWVHYVPVSTGLDELPELVTWLMQTEEGRSRAKRIGQQGREWAARALRDEDRAVYVYRLMLELARIQDPKRPAL